MTAGAGDRRDFLKLAAGAALGAGALPPAIARALATPASRGSGTIRDVEHVVILMQENRSFDHYFGTLRGVRGFGDPRAIGLPGGQSVFLQPKKGGQGSVGPFRLDSDATRAQSLFSLDHSWKGSHARWKRHDAWVTAKGPLTMGYFTRADLPFYYALADAFTVCDAYHCSVFGPTNPNRLYLFSGTSGLALGDQSITVVDNTPLELNETADPARDSPKFDGFSWPTYAERLQGAGVSWKLYQEYDNYGDNGLAYFKSFRGLEPEHPLYRRGRAWAPGSTSENAKQTSGEPLVAQFAADVAAGTLPQVSWIVAPYRLCEHPDASPAEGEHLTARLLEALTAHPEVWSKTVFILNYDENDGFFDHVPPPLPAAGTALGKSTASSDGELYHGEPMGLGPRVPMLVVSPWTKGGFVNSELFDHTSVIRFLEARFGVREPHISPWRRSVAGDLTSVFDFAGAGASWTGGLPDASVEPARAAKARKLPMPKPAEGTQAIPRQEPGQRPARALPYAFEVKAQVGAKDLALTLSNTGKAGATFNLYPAGVGEPRFYTVGAGKSLDDRVVFEGEAYDFSLHGPNGFLRGFRGRAAQGCEAHARFDPATGRLLITLKNSGTGPARLEVAPRDYLHAPARRHHLAPGAELVDAWDLKPSHHWYDFAITSAHDPGFERRIAGHGEDGRPSLSDPALGRQV
ncbi:phosphocholine-specific phospholipase C [Phenylobacterium montanum]|uniref:phospholipase C n=1 Tax=Phenylobacterium montanum TaxID=2823693 RepID=A0A975G181_9CAUL|nr:phospholipase C, phosphocholine-specific [Caulobacter sp. S6]QUD89248.1 phospholipase C, phosphocholine-specific [Caulobacter sp. S6]